MNAIKNLMKLKHIIVINILFLVIGIMLFYAKHDIKIIGAVIATGISLSISITQYKIEDDRMFKELFNEFNSKYDTRFNEMLNRIECNKTLQGQDALDIIDYINLCAEEYLWYSKGRIPEEVWEAWEQGIVYYFNVKAINQIVLTQHSQKQSFYGLFEKIGHKIDGWNKPLSSSSEAKHVA